jgi:3-hydroxyacyl-CoA dehydrogenase / enoyl-CoA hydratase / 3-hydroxybutyryl-CoA epimerase
MSYKNFKFDVDADGIALVTWDMPGRSMNVLNAEVIEELGRIVEQVGTDAAIKGAVVTSGKEAVSGGADLSMLEGLGRMYTDTVKTKGEVEANRMVYEGSRQLSLVYRKLETSVSRGSPPSTAPPWAAASNSASPATAASPPTTRRPASACPRSRSACSPAPAARNAWRA